MLINQGNRQLRQNYYDLPTASIAQWLEHWSCKPGVVSSILTGGLFFVLIQPRK